LHEVIRVGLQYHRVNVLIKRRTLRDVSVSIRAQEKGHIRTCTVERQGSLTRTQLYWHLDLGLPASSTVKK
jgi:hypothetical protein